MVIKVDKEGSKFLLELADLALKGSGVNAMRHVNILSSTVKLTEEPETPKLEAVSDTKEEEK
jgi:hypothetical protein